MHAKLSRFLAMFQEETDFCIGGHDLMALGREMVWGHFWRYTKLPQKRLARRYQIHERWHSRRRIVWEDDLGNIQHFSLLHARVGCVNFFLGQALPAPATTKNNKILQLWPMFWHPTTQKHLKVAWIKKKHHGFCWSFWTPRSSLAPDHPLGFPWKEQH